MSIVFQTIGWNHGTFVVRDEGLSKLNWDNKIRKKYWILKILHSCKQYTTRWKEYIHLTLLNDLYCQNWWQKFLVSLSSKNHNLWNTWCKLWEKCYFCEFLLSNLKLRCSQLFSSSLEKSGFYFRFEWIISFLPVLCFKQER